MVKKQLTFADVSKQLGKVKPETKSIAEELFLAAQKAGHEIWYMWGIGDSVDHRSGLALDLMVRNEPAGDFLRNYIWKHRKRLRLKHVIWEQHITSTVVSPGRRRKMADRGDPTANHYDHPHVRFFPGKYVAPEVVKPAPKPTTPAPPKPTPTTPVPTAPKPPIPAPPKPLEVDGDLSAVTIKRWQQVMGTKVDGKISEDSDLVEAVQKQLKKTVDHRLVVDGDGDSLTFGVERKTVEALQRYLKVPVTRRLSSKNSTTVKALQVRLNTGKF